MKFANLPAFNAELDKAFQALLEQEVVPIFKGVVMEATQALVSGDQRFAYAGTPQWSGNAAANWWPSTDGSVQPFEEIFHVPHPGEKGYVFGETEPYSSKENPNEEAIEMSLLRVRGFLEALPGIPQQVVVENTAPYLLEYQPYGTGPVFRLENLYPLSAMRAAVFMNELVNEANAADFARWKQGWVK